MMMLRPSLLFTWRRSQPPLRLYNRDPVYRNWNIGSRYAEVKFVLTSPRACLAVQSVHKSAWTVNCIMILAWVGGYGSWDVSNVPFGRHGTGRTCRYMVTLLH